MREVGSATTLLRFSFACRIVVILQASPRHCNDRSVEEVLSTREDSRRTTNGGVRLIRLENGVS